MENVVVNRKHKDVLFRMIFNDKEKLLELYNAVNDTSYTNAEYSKLVDKKTLYSRKIQKLPTPRFVVFYNGKPEQPEKQTLYLSSAFQVPTENPEMELKVTVYNINYGKNRKLMEQCSILEEYSIYVDKVKRYSEKTGIMEAVQRAVEECIKENVLKDFLEIHRAEVIEMSIFYYDEEKELELIRQDEYEMGKEDGIEEGIEQSRKSIVENLLKQGILSLEQIMDVAKVSLELVKEVEAELSRFNGR